MSSNLLAFQAIFPIFVVLLCEDVKGYTDEYLKLENCSKSGIKGCYKRNDNLALCFEIRPGFLQLTDKKNNILVAYRKLPTQGFHAQVLDDHLLWHHSAAEPLFIRPGKTTKTTTDGKNHVLHDLTPDAEEISPALYQKIMGKLLGKKEMELLERASHALHDTAKNYNITKLFHVFSMSFVADQDRNTLARDLITADSNRHRCKKHDDNEKRGSCKDMRRDPYNDDCLGMCGPKCRCWSIICDNCCFHKGCYEHDRCCRHRHLSGYCLLPFFHSFSCKRFGGYPACLKAH